MRGDGGGQNLAREAKHLAHRCEIDVLCGSPRRIMPKQKRVGGRKNDGLCGKGPIGKAHPGHGGTDDAREQHGCHSCLSLLFGVEVLEEISCLRRSQTRKKNVEKSLFREFKEYLAI